MTMTLQPRIVSTVWSASPPTRRLTQSSIGPDRRNTATPMHATPIHANNSSTPDNAT